MDGAGDVMPPIARIPSDDAPGVSDSEAVLNRVLADYNWDLLKQILNSRGTNPIHLDIPVWDEFSQTYHTPLIMAILSNRLDMVELLVQNGANPTFALGHQISPFVWALVNGNQEIMQFFIQQGMEWDANALLGLLKYSLTRPNSLYHFDDFFHRLYAWQVPFNQELIISLAFPPNAKEMLPLDKNFWQNLVQFMMQQEWDIHNPDFLNAYIRPIVERSLIQGDFDWLLFFKGRSQWDALGIVAWARTNSALTLLIWLKNHGFSVELSPRLSIDNQLREYLLKRDTRYIQQMIEQNALSVNKRLGTNHFHIAIWAAKMGDLQFLSWILGQAEALELSELEWNAIIEAALNEPADPATREACLLALVKKGVIKSNGKVENAFLWQWALINGFNRLFEYFIGQGGKLQLPIPYGPSARALAIQLVRNGNWRGIQLMNQYYQTQPYVLWQKKEFTEALFEAYTDNPHQIAQLIQDAGMDPTYLMGLLGQGQLRLPAPLLDAIRRHLYPVQDARVMEVELIQGPHEVAWQTTRQQKRQARRNGAQSPTPTRTPDLLRGAWIQGASFF